MLRSKYCKVTSVSELDVSSGQHKAVLTCSDGSAKFIDYLLQPSTTSVTST